MDNPHDLSPFPGLDEVIGDIYETVFEEDGLPRLLERLCAATRSPSAILCRRGADGRGTEHFWGIDPAYDAPMAAYMHQNLLAHRMHLVQVDDPTCDTDLVRREEWRGLALYEEVWKPAGLHQCLGILFDRDRGGVASLAFFRPGEDGSHGAQSRRIAAVLSPHLRRAMKLQGRLAGSRLRSGLCEDALDRLALPLLVVDLSRAGRIVHANRAAETELRVSAHLTVSWGRLAAQSAPDRDRMTALYGALRHGIGGSTALGVDGAEPTWMIASPLPENRACTVGLPQRGQLALIALRNGTGPSAADRALLQSLFDLSPAEAELALALGGGQTLAQASSSRRVSLNTSRTQLKAVFAKTGVARQADLAGLLARLDVLRR
ncbi:helix-turn-helix transcriptional regulator [Poseidonocella sp. HB161398]|uniref:helix-turn-helix transcriptional regulator n=1 Tax=Poseidonocella sp. HB161398 TaxID=2320855 RepID=UPI0011094A85|nr:helix-turn-helix transcriptional regulator [Poseidonocella sp. HB161398]